MSILVPLYVFFEVGQSIGMHIKCLLFVKLSNLTIIKFSTKKDFFFNTNLQSYQKCVKVPVLPHWI